MVVGLGVASEDSAWSSVAHTAFSLLQQHCKVSALRD